MGEPSRKVEKRDGLLGRVINDRYKITATIARGGMGKVYRAEQMPLGRQVALKVLDPKHTGESDPEFHKRFFLEASTAAKLTHPNTVTIFDYGHTADDDVYFIAMELVEGRTLSSILKKDGPMEAQRAIQICMQICRSLREAHRLGIIHRDLKPANVLLTTHADEEDFVKVLDFGLVKNVDAEEDDLTKAGVFMGSPKYMSPEQISGQDVDGRSDIYALGVLLYQMLTGDVPFEGPSPVQTLMMHMKQAPPPLNGEGRPEVHPLLEQLVLKCLEKKPDGRFDTMNDLLGALKAVGQQIGLAVPSGSRSLTLSGDDLSLSGTRSADGMTATPSGALTPDGGLSFATPSGVRSKDGQQVPQVEVIEFDDAPKSKGKWLALAAVALLAVGGGAYATMGGEQADPSAEADDTAGTEQAAEPVEEEPEPEPLATDTVEEEAEPEPEPQPIQRVLVTLRSEPSGAMVQVGEQTYGPTPAQVEWVREDADRGREVTFKFTLDRHHDAEVTKTVEGDRLEVEADLRRIVPRWTRRRNTGSSEMESSSMSDEAVVVPSGYLDSPY